MKIYICCSKHFYHKIKPIKEELEKKGHVITLPNTYEDPFKEEDMKKEGKDAHIQWKSAMIRAQEAKVKANDALVVLNFEKKGLANYIGGATFLEIFKAFDLGKKVFLYNPIPDSIFTDELTAMNPTVINGHLSKVYTQHSARHVSSAQ